MGDVKFAFAMGIFLGYEKFLLAIIIASVVGMIVMLTAKHRKNLDDNHEFPFGPFLALGFVFSALFGNSIINTYLSLLGL